MKYQILTLLLPALISAATTTTEPYALQAFEALPNAANPSHPAQLAWKEEGFAQGYLGSSDFGVAITAPHFLLLHAQRELDVRDPSRKDSTIYSENRKRLRLGTGLALSQCAPVPTDFDLAVGINMTMDRLQNPGPYAEDLEQVSLDPSMALKWGTWRFSSTWNGGISLKADSLLPVRARLATLVGRELPSGFSWGVALDVPLEKGETGLRIAGSRAFRDALQFSAQLGTSYRKEVDPQDNVVRLRRRSLTLQLATSLRLRPFNSSSDPEWMARLVDPFLGSPPSHWLYDWQLDAQAGWDAVGAESRAGLALGRHF